MSAPSPQNYANHGRLVFGYHVATALLLLLNLGYAGWTLVRGFTFGNIVYLTTAVALVMISYYARAFALAVQDRIIRLEERLRLQRLLPHDMHSRIVEFTVPQLVGLRFASDGELVNLAKRVLDEKIVDRDAIKKLIADWRPDDCRA